VFLFLCCVGAVTYYVQKTKIPAVSSVAEAPVKKEAAAKSSAEVAPPTPTVTLERPSGTTRAQTRDKAYRTLFAKWQIAYDPVGRYGPLEQAKSQGLFCLEEKGSLADLRRMNRPAVLKLGSGKDEYYAALLSLDENTATVVIGDETRSVNVGEIAARWSGDYVLLWRGPKGYGNKLKPGSQGPAVAWLDSRLGRVQGREPSSDPRPLYDEKMENRVREFQTAAGLVADGIAGARTVICLTSAAGDSGPVLRDRKGSN
jgi:general secretion pathway protein A